jgi:hypothetical protein
MIRDERVSDLVEQTRRHKTKVVSAIPPFPAKVMTGPDKFIALAENHP